MIAIKVWVMGKNIAENTPKKVWIMGYGRVMGYAWHFPANEVSNPENVWSIREYGFIGVWVKRESTVSMKLSFYELAMNALELLAEQAVVRTEGHVIPTTPQQGQQSDRHQYGQPIVPTQHYQSLRPSPTQPPPSSAHMEHIYQTLLKITCPPHSNLMVYFTSQNTGLMIGGISRTMTISHSISTHCTIQRQEFQGQQLYEQDVPEIYVAVGGGSMP
ncbi:hypothetical protein C8R41DRAFT_871448 [Lentinula lateritia]|uniref:Uncharacterized protein n=1 Tax=Lentinula lateritia TaxID=40482 RepID=A0ABQ8UZM5_9AGAR|nr:hypothetical protein C8R41DRAFT_871448 [Lentinula lateritia]